MKKMISVIMVFILCGFICSKISVSASNIVEEPQKPVIIENFIALWTASASISINGSTATCLGAAKAQSNAYSILITMHLQKKSGSSWVSISTWTGSGSGITGASLSKTKSGIGSGNYRTCLIATAYDSSGRYIETTTEYSRVISV